MGINSSCINKSAIRHFPESLAQTLTTSSSGKKNSSKKHSNKGTKTNSNSDIDKSNNTTPTGCNEESKSLARQDDFDESKAHSKHVALAIDVESNLNHVFHSKRKLTSDDNDSLDEYNVLSTSCETTCRNGKTITMDLSQLIGWEIYLEEYGFGIVREIVSTKPVTILMQCCDGRVSEAPLYISKNSNSYLIENVTLVQKLS